MGVVRVVRSGQTMKEIFVDPSGLQHGLEEVLILTESVHQAIPEHRLAVSETGLHDAASARPRLPPGDAGRSNKTDWRPTPIVCATDISRSATRRDTSSEKACPVRSRRTST